MRTSIDELFALERLLLADGATGTNLMGTGFMGLGPGEPPAVGPLTNAPVVDDAVPSRAERGQRRRRRGG